jgi:dolichol-phosphate mannosyltransferase
MVLPVAPVSLSVVIPVHDEQGAIPALAVEMAQQLDGAGLSWEAIWVDDGSRDGTLALLRDLPPPHRHLALAHNGGMSAAYRAGFAAARGAWLATLDGDGQNDPADLPRLWAIAQGGTVDYLCGVRTPRQDHGIRRLSSRIANRARDLLTGVRIQDAGCSTRLFRRDLLVDLPVFRNDFLYFPAFASRHGWRVAETPVRHRPRTTGRAHFGIGNRLWSGMVDLLGVCWLLRRQVRYVVGDATGVTATPRGHASSGQAGPPAAGGPPPAPAPDQAGPGG